jgi:hypothetical protein
MIQYIYQAKGDYFLVEAASLHDAMLTILPDNGVIIGEYSQYAHLFNE